MAINRRARREQGNASGGGSSIATTRESRPACSARATSGYGTRRRVVRGTRLRRASPLHTIGEDHEQDAGVSPLGGTSGASAFGGRCSLRRQLWENAGTQVERVNGSMAALQAQVEQVPSTGTEEWWTSLAVALPRVGCLPLSFLPRVRCLPNSTLSFTLSSPGPGPALSLVIRARFWLQVQSLNIIPDNARQGAV